jgi:hypothetical protein
MDIKVGNVFVRRSDEGVWKVKKIDGHKVLLESSDQKLAMTDIYGLEKSYRKIETSDAWMARSLSKLSNRRHTVTCFKQFRLFI